MRLLRSEGLRLGLKHLLRGFPQRLDYLALLLVAERGLRLDLAGLE